MRKLATLSSLVAVMLLIPAIALADRYPSFVSIHSTDDQNRIYGVVQAPKHKCEKQRRVVLRYQAPNTSGFVPVDETLSNNSGEYEFNGTKEKRGGSLPDGQYKARALRKPAGNDVCKGAESRVIELIQI